MVAALPRPSSVSTAVSSRCGGAPTTCSQTRPTAAGFMPHTYRVTHPGVAERQGIRVRGEELWASVGKRRDKTLRSCRRLARDSVFARTLTVVPPGRFELPPLPPEGSALSPELWGPGKTLGYQHPGRRCSASSSTDAVEPARHTTRTRPERPNSAGSGRFRWVPPRGPPGRVTAGSRSPRKRVTRRRPARRTRSSPP